MERKSRFDMGAYTGFRMAEYVSRTLCGFSSPAHLSDAFLRETGLRPSRYRLR